MTEGAPPAALVAPAEQRELEALRAGDEETFRALINRHGPSMIRVALLFVRGRPAAEDVVQETWLRVIRGLPRFEGRSSLRTWIFVVLANCARERAKRDGRSIPLSELERELGERLPEDERMFPPDHPRWAGMWSTCVRHWDDLPEEQLLSHETLALVRAAADRLPPVQRAVLTLRDIGGWAPEDVCELLGLTGANQRVLLHRARGTVRRRLEHYFEKEA
jgi:RNA polymerase sigma-70 factor (ECF subfamily)